MVLLLASLLCYTATTLASPLLNINQTTNLPTDDQNVLHDESAQPWVPASSVRSTWEILYTCLAALVTCFASFVPINLPAPDEKWWSKLLRKAKWMIITILLPELVVVNALLQRRAAIALKQQLSAIYAQRQKDGQASVPGEPSLAYCFFVVNGGLVVDTGNMHNTKRRMTLTPRAISRLALINIDIDISLAQITELQNVDVLGRVVATWQLTWLITTVIGRRAQSLPISLLELNTVINIGFAVCLRLLWWDSPSDVSHPLVVLEDENLHKFVAMMLMATDIRPRKDKRNISEFDYLYFSDEETVSQENEDQAPVTHCDLEAVRTTGPRSGRYDDLDIIIDRTKPQKVHYPGIPNEPLSKLKLYKPFMSSLHPSHGEHVKTIKVGEGSTISGLAPYPKYFEENSYIALSGKDLHRWELAASVLRDRSINFRHYITSKSVDLLTMPEAAVFFDECLTERAKNSQISIDTLLGLTFEENLLASEDLPNIYITIALLLHGALHLVAWNWRFPTKPEQILWKLSSFGLMLGLLPVLALRMSFTKVYSWAFYLEWALVAVLVVVMSVCSIFLFLESFLALRMSPSGIYVRLEWSAYLPSLG